jgi:hypothetical protein
MLQLPRITAANKCKIQCRFSSFAASSRRQISIVLALELVLGASVGRANTVAAVASFIGFFQCKLPLTRHPEDRL